MTPLGRLEVFSAHHQLEVVFVGRSVDRVNEGLGGSSVGLKRRHDLRVFRLFEGFAEGLASVHPVHDNALGVFVFRDAMEALEHRRPRRLGVESVNVFGFGPGSVFEVQEGAAFPNFPAPRAGPLHQVQQAFLTVVQVGKNGASVGFSVHRLLVHPIQQIGFCVNGELGFEHVVLSGAEVAQCGPFHLRFEFAPRQGEQVQEGGFVDQEPNHVQPHDQTQRPVPFEGIAAPNKQRERTAWGVRAFKNSQPSPDTGGFGLATIKEQIEMIRAEIDKTQKNKATNAHIGKLKAKIAQLKLKEEKAAAHSKASGGGKGFEVRKSGDATVALVGFPSVGKSTLISKVTDAHSEAGGYAFTTLTCIPGVMEHRGAKIQILDLPGLIKGAAEGKGRGREILNVIRSADMVLYIVDPFQDGHFNVLHRELHNAGLRLNEVKPPVFIKRTDRGGIEVRSTVEQTHLTEDEMADIIRSFGYTSALVTLREDSTAEQIVDALAGNRVYEKAVIAINKIDIATDDDIARARSALPQEWPIMNISAFKDIGLDELKDFIYDNLGFMRVFLKPQGQEADMEEPLIVKDDSTVENICVKLHRDFVRKFRFARIRGPSAKFDDQRVGLDHQLKDGDVLTIVVKR